MPLSLVTSAGKVVTRRFLLSFYGLQKFKGLHDHALIGIKKTLRNMAVFLCCIITRARIGLKITYSTACLFGRYGVNRLKLRCKRVSLIG